MKEDAHAQKGLHFRSRKNYSTRMTFEFILKDAFLKSILCGIALHELEVIGTIQNINDKKEQIA